MDAMVWLQDGLDERFIRLLVELGADVNYLSDDGGCPLSDACLLGSPALVEYLLTRGANPNVVYDFSDSVLGAVHTDLAYHELSDIRRRRTSKWSKDSRRSSRF
jgi:ankyrin repeat protein